MLIKAYLSIVRVVSVDFCKYKTKVQKKSAKTETTRKRFQPTLLARGYKKTIKSLTVVVLVGREV